MNHEFWSKSVAFHGHECPGLAIGVRVCEAVVMKMGVAPSFDEELVCITENDACGVDAVQVILSCTMGKGNLIYKPTGKQAFTFFRRDSTTSNLQAMRFYLKAAKNDMQRSQYQDFLLSAPFEELFDCKIIQLKQPERARLFSSVLCDKCGERAAEHKMRLQDGFHVCLDCYNEYTRGW